VFWKINKWWWRWWWWWLVDMWCERITSAYHSKRCTGRYEDTGEDQVDHERTGGAQSTKTCKRWGSPWRKQRWQLLTDMNSVGVWSNVSAWIWDESRSRMMMIMMMMMIYLLHTRARCGDAGTKASLRPTSLVCRTTMSPFTGRRWTSSYCRHSMTPLRCQCNVTSPTGASFQSVALSLCSSVRL